MSFLAAGIGVDGAAARGTFMSSVTWILRSLHCWWIRDETIIGRDGWREGMPGAGLVADRARDAEAMVGA